MNNLTYNLKRHVELLKAEENFGSYNFFKEAREESLELARYSIMVEDQIFWEDRFEVASVIQAFLNKEMDEEEFHGSVFGLYHKYLAKSKKFFSKLVSGEIKDFHPDLRSSGFASLISFLRGECEVFEKEYSKEFEDSIKAWFLNLQKALEEEEDD